MRSEFEMLPFVALMLDDNFIFVEQSNEYTHKNHTEHRVTLGYLNGAWLTYQHQQSKVDELQKQKSLQELEINQIAHANQQWQLKCVELQKRVDALIQKYKDEDRELKLIDEWEKSQIYGLVASELEQALKGGSDE